MPIGKRKRIRQQLRGNISEPKDPKYLASCYGKVRRTKEDAYELAKDLPNMKAYKCSYCGNGTYHVGRRS